MCCWWYSKVGKNRRSLFSCMLQIVEVSKTRKTWCALGFPWNHKETESIAYGRSPARFVNTNTVIPINWIWVIYEIFGLDLNRHDCTITEQLPGHQSSFREFVRQLGCVKLCFPRTWQHAQNPKGSPRKKTTTPLPLQMTRTDPLAHNNVIPVPANWWRKKLQRQWTNALTAIELSKSEIHPGAHLFDLLFALSKLLRICLRDVDGKHLGNQIWVL